MIGLSKPQYGEERERLLIQENRIVVDPSVQERPFQIRPDFIVATFIFGLTAGSELHPKGNLLVAHCHALRATERASRLRKRGNDGAEIGATHGPAHHFLRTPSQTSRPMTFTSVRTPPAPIGGLALKRFSTLTVSCTPLMRPLPGSE